MSSTRKNHPASFKAKVVLEALREEGSYFDLVFKTWHLCNSHSSLEKRGNVLSGQIPCQPSSNESSFVIVFRL